MNRKIKFLIIDTYYPGFLRDFYRAHPDVKSQPYKKNKNALLNQCFGTSDYYSFNLCQNGHLADDVVVNDEILQQKWALENGLTAAASGWYSKIQMLPYLHRFIGRPKWVQGIALSQIKQAKADVVYLQDLSILNPDTLREAKKFCKMLVGQIACPFPAEENLKQFDLILTSFPHYVEKFRKMGIKSVYFRIGFEPRVLERVGKYNRMIDVAFIGSFSPNHNIGTKLLEEVASNLPVHVWGQGIHFLSARSPLRKNYHGPAWGLEMYKILAQAKIVINRHIGAAENFANNMRLYESTGMGAMLITDDKKNLNELFKVGSEVASYKNVTDLLGKIDYYLKHDGERERIAKAGQRRTLSEHNYNARMKELVSIISRYL